MLHDGRRLQGQRPAQALVAFMRPIILRRQGIGESDAREGEALLLFQVRQCFGQTQPQFVFPAAQKIRIEQGAHVFGRHRPVGDAALRRLHFDQRLQP